MPDGPFVVVVVVVPFFVTTMEVGVASFKLRTWATFPMDLKN